MRLIRRRLTYANVIATIALFGVLAGGGAYAAQRIGSKQIKPNAVAAKHLKNNAVKGRKIGNNGVALSKLKNDVLFARVTNQGDLVEGRSRGAVDAELEGDLRLIVTFNQTVNRCHPFVSLHTGVARFATVQTADSAVIQGNQVRVTPRDQNGAINNQAFSLLLVCP